MGARIHPVIDNLDRVPDNPAIRRLSSGSCEDAEKANNGKDEGDNKCLDVLSTWLVGITREVGDIQSQCGVVS